MWALQVESPKCCVCLVISTVGDIYRAVGELHRLGEVSLAPSGGQSAKPSGRPTGWSGLHRLCPPPLPLLLLMLTRVLEAVGQTDIKHGQPALGPFWPTVWPTQSMCQIHLRGDDDFDIWSTLLCHPLKC
jgi:hypothetical protein